MLEIVYTSSFVRQFKKLPKALQDEVEEKISIFAKDPSHPFLKKHKLKGSLRNYYSFSVNYAYRVVFEYDSKNTVALLAIGDHDVYK